jgi:hypothetical protein
LYGENLQKSQFSGKSSKQCSIGVTVPVPPLVMEMQTGGTNDYISQIFFVFAAPIYWLAALELMLRYNRDCHVSSTSSN